MFDWQDFLNQHRIDYSRGKNVGRDEIAIKCPYCADDPSHHLAISLQGRGWICRRNEAHHGKSAARLVQQLLRCTREHAARLVGDPINIPDDFAAQVSLLLDPPKQEQRGELEMPSEFKPLDPSRPSAKPYINYLRKRNYTDQQIKLMHRTFGLRYATSGPFAHRIIFPIFYRKRLVSWTGRTINSSVDLRYKTIPAQQGIGSIRDYLLWFDDLRGGNLICICEGPFDALRLRTEGFAATCLFTTTASASQLNHLHDVLPRYRYRALMLDQGTLPIALRLQAQLQGHDVRVVTLPSNVKDPGELSRSRLLEILRLQ